MYLEEVVELREGVGCKEEKKRKDKKIADPKEDGKTERRRDIYGMDRRKDNGREKGREKREERNKKEIR